MAIVIIFIHMYIIFFIIAMLSNYRVRSRYLWWRLQEYMSLFKWSQM